MIFEARELTNLHQIAERDGFLWDVSEIIKETEKTITVRLNSDFSSFKKHSHGNTGIVKTFRKSTKLHGVVPDSEVVLSDIAKDLYC